MGSHEQNLCMVLSRRLWANCTAAAKNSLLTFQLHVGDEISRGTCSSLFCQDLHALESDLAVSAKKQDWSCDCGDFMCTYNYMMCNA